MADKEYYGSAQFQPIAQQRPHDDSYAAEIIMTGAKLDIDFAEFMNEDILKGNTATLRRFEKANRFDQFEVRAVDGTTDDRLPATKAIVQDFYPMIPLKDDDVGSGGYSALPDTDQRKMDVEKSLGYLDMDLEEISNAVLTPEEIPVLGTTEWFREYGKTWRDSESLQEEFVTEAAWRDSLVAARAEQTEAIDDITDVHIGIYATPGTLDEANIVAVYFEMSKLLPQLSFRGYNDADIPDFPPQSYIYQVNSGSWLTVNGMRGWTHIIRKGILENKYDTPDSIDQYNKKSNVNFYYGTDYVRSDAEGDPIDSIIRSDPLWQEKLHTSQSVPGNTGVPGDIKTLIELQVQLTRGDNPTYGEIRMWNYETSHIITNDKDSKITLIRGGLGGKVTGAAEGPSIGDENRSSTINFNEIYVGKYGTDDIDIVWSIADMYAGPMFNIGRISGEVNFNSPPGGGTYYLKLVAVGNGPESTGAQSVIYLTVTVLNSDGSSPPVGTPPWEDDNEGHEPDDENYQDLCYFPIGRESTKEVPIFQRERLLRETVQLSIYSVKIVKLKWYQSRWFSIVIFIVAILFSWVTSGQSLVIFMQTMIIQTAIGLAISIVVKVLAQFINNPFIIAIAAVIVAVVTGYADMANLMKLANIAMDVTNTAIKEIMAIKMKELKEEMEEFSQMANDFQEELDKMMEEVGLMRIDAWEYLKRMLVVPDAEMPKHLIERTISVAHSLEPSIQGDVDVHNLWDSMVTQQ